jgi:hypothetical protein
MALSERENTLRTANFEGGEWIPASVSISDASWVQWRGEMEAVAARHPLFWPDFNPGRRDFDNWTFEAGCGPGERFADNWGCVWDHAWGGIAGQVVGHPLSDWSALAAYRPPDPLTQTARRDSADWEAARRNVEEAKRQGRLTGGGLEHGFFLMRLTYLRGFENLMLDLATRAPELPRLIAMVGDYSRVVVQKWLELGVDKMTFGEDLGTQTASLISPAAFREWVMPTYRDLMQPCRERGAQVYLHSDGYIMELVDLLLECGVTILNPQDLCNGIDDLARHVKGRVCIALDIDRQKIVPFGTRREIRELIREEVMKLGSPRGGLMFVCGIYPPTPPENVDALCCALEEFRTYWRA